MSPEINTSGEKLGVPRIAAQVGFYLLIGLFIGYFTYSPTYQYTDGQQIELKFVVRYSGDLIGECRDLTEEEMQKLPPNMRKTQVCPREKSPMTVTLSVNGDELYGTTIKPSGIQNDGVLAFYKSFKLPAEALAVQFSIEGGEVYEQTINVDPGDVILLHYDDSGFHLRRANEKST